MTSKGFVYIVGAGPGDPRLITVRGLQCLSEADVVVYDRLVSPLLLAYARSGARMIYVGKSPGNHTLGQDEINELLVREAQNGFKVVRLKGGDPFVFGRGGEEAMALKEKGIHFEVIPGITSAISVPAYAGIPVTHRKVAQSFAVLTGHGEGTAPLPTIAWPSQALSTGTIICLMGIAQLEGIAGRLLAEGRDPQTPVALIRWGTRAVQQTMTGTLASIVERARERNFQSPAVTVIGEVVSLREDLRWWEQLPLAGRRVLVTRARGQERTQLGERLERLGAEVAELPAISVESSVSLDTLDAAMDGLTTGDWIAFTSQHAVEVTLQRWLERDRDVRALAGISFACVGRATAQVLSRFGIRADHVPEGDFRAETLGRFFDEEISSGTTVLWPRGDRAETAWIEPLTSRAVRVVDPVVYATQEAVCPEWVERWIAEAPVDVVTFASGSAVQSFVTMLGNGSVEDIHANLASAAVVCMGPVTAAAAQEQGLSVSRIAEQAKLDSLADAVCSLLESTPRRFQDDDSL